MILYHGSKEIVEFPEIRTARYNKDFYFGFYCTQMPEQAVRWATRYGTRGYLNKYEYTENSKLKYLVFDTIYNYIQNYIDGKISRAAFWELAKFNHPTHQISFHTVSALSTLRYVGNEVVYGG